VLPHWIHHLVTVRKLAFSSCNQQLAGIKFFYRQVLNQQGFDLRVPAKRSGRLPEPLSREEVARLLLAAAYNSKHRTMPMTAYATDANTKGIAAERRPLTIRSRPTTAGMQPALDPDSTQTAIAPSDALQPFCNPVIDRVKSYPLPNATH